MLTLTMMNNNDIASKFKATILYSRKKFLKSKMKRGMLFWHTVCGALTQESG